MSQAAIEIPPLSLIERYGVTGPRFACWPETTSFDPVVGDSAFRAALARSNDQLIPAPLSLYLHIPFCRSLCYHCACDKKVTRNPDVVSGYMTALHREIANKAALIDADRCVQQLHIGGGTPTYLNAGQRAALMDCIATHFRLAHCERRDFSIEIDPRTLSPEAMCGLRDAGFNRIVLGVQDFDPAVQRAINRECSYEQVAGQVAAARAAGFASISVDLVYGLPRQSTTSFARTIEQILSLAPDAVSVFDYTHRPEQFPAQRLLDKRQLPDEPARVAIFRDSVRRLQRGGYDYIGMDHFALPDSYLATAKRELRLHHCMQGYTPGAGSETLGFGASAISQIGDGYFQAVPRQHLYRDAIESGGMAIRRGRLCNADDRRVADVIQSIMCYGHCDMADWESRYRVGFRVYFKRALQRLAPMVDDGLVRLDADVVAVTPLGVVFLRSVAACFAAGKAPATPLTSPA